MVTSALLLLGLQGTPTVRGQGRTTTAGTNASVVDWHPIVRKHGAIVAIGESALPIPIKLPAWLIPLKNVGVYGADAGRENAEFCFPIKDEQAIRDWISNFPSGFPIDGWSGPVASKRTKPGGPRVYVRTSHWPAIRDLRGVWAYDVWGVRGKYLVRILFETMHDMPGFDADAYQRGFPYAIFNPHSPLVGQSHGSVQMIVQWQQVPTSAITSDPHDGTAAK